MKEIPLSQGKVAIVDDTDYEWLNQWKWYAHKGTNTFYVTRHSKKASGKRKAILMHIEIIGKREGLMTDHINGNGLDNRRENLRHVTRRQNAQNQCHRNASSRYPGVSWSKWHSKWIVNFRVDSKLKYLGLFVNELAAAEAYNKALGERGEVTL